MDVDKIQGYFRWLIYIFELYFLYSLQQTNALALGCFEAKPLLILPAFVSIALFENEFVGMSFGIVAGVLLDFSFGNPLGLYAVFLCAAGYIIGVLSIYFLRSNFWTALLLTALLTASILALRFCFDFAFHGLRNENFLWINVYIPVVVYSVAVTPIIFLFNRSISYFVRGGGGQNKIKLS